MGIMTNGQYKRLVEAKAAGDTELVERIKAEPYGAEVIDVDVVQEALPEIDLTDNVLGDLAAGIDRSEICSKYGITTQKISAIVKKAK